MIAWVITAMTGISVVSIFIEKYAVNYTMYEPAVIRRWIQWGTFDGWAYFLVKLPSWEWERHLILHHRDPHAWCWHQRVLIWNANPDDYVHGWHVRLWPVHLLKTN